MRIKTVELACKLDRFCEEFDPYNYRDCVDDRKRAVADTLKMINDKNFTGIKKWLNEVIEDLDEGTAEVKAAKMLFKELTDNGLREDQYENK